MEAYLAGIGLCLGLILVGRVLTLEPEEPLEK